MALAWKTRHHKRGSIKFRPNGFGWRIFGPKIFCSIVRVEDHLIMIHKNYFFLSYRTRGPHFDCFLNFVITQFLFSSCAIQLKWPVPDKYASLQRRFHLQIIQAMDCGQSNSSLTSKVISNWSWSSSSVFNPSAPLSSSNSSSDQLWTIKFFVNFENNF